MDRMWISFHSAYLSREHCRVEMISILLCLSALVLPASSAFCGISAIPYSLEVLPGGGTVLGCARPSCFGWNPSNGLPVSTDETFSMVNGNPDGFFRSGPASRDPFDINDPRVYNQQSAECSPTYQVSCGPNQWMAGVQTNLATNQSLVQCCSIPALSQATDRGVANVQSDQIVIGGEVLQDGVQTHFDYIQNVQRVIQADGSIGYDVSVGRFPCQDIPAVPPPFIGQQFVPPPVQPVAPVQYYPSSASSNYFCFTADTKVRTQDGGEKRMDELTKNDWIQTVTKTSANFARVSFWLHRVPSQDAEFIKISLSNGNELKMTNSHFIYKTECSDGESEVPFANVSRSAVSAENVVEGDCLYTVPVSGRPVTTRVTKIETVMEKGIYAPMTTNGKIVVNGVLASCHSLVQNQPLQSSFFEMVNIFHEYMTRHSPLSHSSTEERHLPSTLEYLISLLKHAVPEALMSV